MQTEKKKEEEKKKKEEKERKHALFALFAFPSKRHLLFSGFPPPFFAYSFSFVTLSKPQLQIQGEPAKFVLFTFMLVKEDQFHRFTSCTPNIVLCCFS